MKLTVRLNDSTLHVRFLRLVKKDIPLEEIVCWEAGIYRPILGYGDWGIRYGWKGRAYNVSGNRGVQLELVHVKQLLIGSQRPVEPAAAISRAKQNGGYLSTGYRSVSFEVAKMRRANGAQGAMRALRAIGNERSKACLCLLRS